MTTRDGLLKAAEICEERAAADCADAIRALAAKEPGGCPESSERREAEWKALDVVIDKFVADYELEVENDGYHFTTEDEPSFIHDCIQGLLLDDAFMKAIAQVYPVRTQLAAAPTERTAAGNGGQDSLTTDSQESPADECCQSAVLPATMPDEPYTPEMNDSDSQMTIHGDSCAMIGSNGLSNQPRPSISAKRVQEICDKWERNSSEDTLDTLERCALQVLREAGVTVEGK